MCKLVPEVVRRFDFDMEVGAEEWKTKNYWFVKPVDFRVRVRTRMDIDTEEHM